jgi:hypothetical protein
MNMRWKVGLGLAALAVFAGALLLDSGRREKAAAEKTRLALRRQGFKTDLADFDLSAPLEIQRRSTGFFQNRYGHPGAAFLNHADLMAPVGEHAAVVLWKQAELPPPSGFTAREYQDEAGVGQDAWPLLRANLQPEREQLDGAVSAALSGPIRFDLKAQEGAFMELPHLPGLKYFIDRLGCRMILALHGGDENTAWTNLLAATRLITAWQTEPVEVSQLVRANCLETLYDLTWQALQAGDWPEERLALLQREWEALDLFGIMPDMVAFSGAGHVDMYRQQRERPAQTALWTIGPPRRPQTTLWMTAPPPPRPAILVRGNRVRGNLIETLMQYIRDLEEARYRSYGTYADEKDLLLFYRDRELEIRRAIRSPSWSEMRGLPGTTNEIVFRSRSPGGHPIAQNVMRPHRIAWAYRGAGVGLLGDAAQAEARRRLVVAALALERFHARHGAYPNTLAELAPDFLKAPPVDFMDGRPLRYAPAGDGHFLLYSVGLDCVDDGGRLPPEPQERSALLSSMGTGGAPAGADLVWPIPASSAAAKARAEEVEKRIELAKADRQRREAEAAALRAASRQRPGVLIRKQ